MKALRRIVSVVLFLTLVSVQLAGVAHAQYGNSGGGRGGKTQQPAAEADYDYVADSQNEWTAEYGEEDGSGNWYYYHNPLYDAAHEKEVGWADGYCIQTVADAYQYCTWSLYTDSWTLSAYGVLDQSTGDNWYAIAGGTGDYADVHGYLGWSASEDGSQYYYTVQEQEYTTYDPLRVEASTENWHSTYWYDPSYTYSNVWYWHDSLYAEDGATEIGWIDGYCIRTAPNAASECNYTVAGDGWSITASGRKYDEGTSWLSITGGWGEYEGATGTVAWDSSEDGQNWYEYHFDYLPTTLAKPYEVYQSDETGYFYADLVEPEKADGDTYYWHSNLWDANQEYKVGWGDGYCVITAPGEYSICTVTLYNDYWTLTVSGPSYETSDPSTFAVTGGTGAYADVSGTVTVTPNEDVTAFTISMDLYVAPYTYWQSVGWDQISEEEAGYWYTLGWNEYNWDGSHPAAVPDSEERVWAELTPYEQEAATALGYDESTWNPSAPRKPDGDPDAYWDGYDWEDLYLSEKHLWAILGWNEYNWSGVPEASMPASEWRTWAELKPVEQGAAAWLGYDETTWNVHIIRTPEGDPEEYWSQYAWDELHYSEQEVFAYLGWNADAWAGDQPIPESKYRTWEQLSHVEKGAASQLGYNAENWDAKVLAH